MTRVSHAAGRGVAACLAALALVIAVACSCLAVPAASAAPADSPVDWVTDKAASVAGAAQDVLGGIGEAVGGVEIPGTGGTTIGDVAAAARSAATWVGDKAAAVAEAGLGVAGAVAEGVSSVAQLATMPLDEAVQAVILSAGEWVVSMLGSAAAWVLTTVVQFVFWVVAPDLDAPFIYSWASRTFAIAVPLTLLLAMWQIISASVRGRPGAGARQAFVGATAATVGTMIFIPIATAISAGIDSLCLVMMDDVEGDIDALGQTFADIWSVATLKTVGDAMGSGAQAVVGSTGLLVLALILALFAICVVVAGAGLLIVMTIRTMSLYVIEVVMPIAMSGLAARTSRAWPRRVLGWLLALIVSKLGVVIVLGLGVTILNERSQDARSSESVSQLLWYLGDLAVGAAMVLIAVMTPWVTFKFLDFLGEEAVAYAQRSLENGVRQAGTKVGDTVKTLAAVVGAAAGGAAGSAGGGAGSGSASSSSAAAGQVGSKSAASNQPAVAPTSTQPQAQSSQKQVGGGESQTGSEASGPGQGPGAQKAAASVDRDPADVQGREPAESPGPGQAPAASGGGRESSGGRHRAAESSTPRRPGRKGRSGRDGKPAHRKPGVPDYAVTGGFGDGAFQEDDIPGWRVG